MTLRLLTYNIHHTAGNDRVLDPRRIAAVIAESGGDLVGLNEVYHPYPVAPGRQPMLDEIADALGMRYLFGSTLATIPGAPQLAAYGNAMLSRYPWRNAGTFRLPTPETCETRGAIWAEVEVNGIRLMVGTVHLENTAEEARIAQVEHLLSLAAQFSHPQVLLGDFNALAPGEFQDSTRGQIAPASATQVITRMLRAGYVDAQAAVGRGPRESWSTVRPAIRIDYIWLSPELRDRLIACERWDTPLARVASDHFPVWCELAI